MARSAEAPPAGIAGTAAPGAWGAAVERCAVPGPAGPKTSWRT